MPDDLPGRSKDEGAGRALTRVEFERRERARKALELWKDGASYAQIKNRLKLRSTDEARRQVEKGEEMWTTEELTAKARYQALQTDDLMMARGKVIEAIEDGNLSAVPLLEKVWGRLSRLRDLDVQTDEVAGGPQIVVIDSRPPWQRDEVVDSTATDEEAPKGLPVPDDADPLQ